MSTSTPIPKPVVLVVIGVTGSGKTTIATIMASRLGWRFQEGDSLHPPANIEKMKAGRPLSDDDRAPWLQKVATWVEEQVGSGQNGVITCSALKRSYRELINRRGSSVVFVFLSVSEETVAARMAARQGHFMPSTLLNSQFADLEEPSADEPAMRVDASSPPGVVADRILNQLGL